MIPTPDLSHLSAKDYDHVYEPAEDTFLLLDALEEDEKELKDLHPSISLEIGPGSGCVSAFIGKILGPSVLYLCSDINPHACTCTRATGTQNKVTLDVINASFASPLTLRLKHAVDIILFNPPYVPTIQEEMSDAQDKCSISGSWAGGMDGMNVTNIFLEHVEELLSERGRFYLVAVAENDVPGIQERMSKLHGLRSDIVLSRRAGREHLFVIRFIRDPSRSKG
ncbi:eRF1 methyltransferase catalytic subunit mtq2 [Termitomyces sp. T112]|nr:eRF1 methyltransferase catalytic subunit mtq2 [Termitomyces sp. T112]